MAKTLTRKKTPARASGAKKTFRARSAPKSAAPRSIAKVKCAQCGAPKGRPHATDCPDGHCTECRGTLGHLLTCSRHPNYRGPVLDGKTGAVLETDVDGKAAKVKITSKPPKPAAGAKKKAAAEGSEDKGIKRIAPPIVTDPALFEALQYAVDRKIIFGVKQALTTFKQCDEEWFDDKSSQSVGCASLAMFDFETLDTCKSCKHTKKKILKIQCISHMALRITGELKDRQTNMFDADGDGE